MSAKKKSPDAPTFEASFQRLEEIVQKLEQGDVPLEDSLRLYEEGIALSRACAQTLSKAELTLKRLAKDLEGNFSLLDEEPE